MQDTTAGLTQFERSSQGMASHAAWCCYAPELLERARRRIQVVAWLLLAVMTVGSIVDLTYASWIVGIWDPWWLAPTGVAVAASLGMIVVAKDRRVGHVAVLCLGLLYEVIICFVIAIIMPWTIYVETGVLPYVTWVTPLIILFPLIVPSPPRMTLITAISAAATRPAGLFVLETFSVLPVEPVSYINSALSPVFAAAIAYAGARIVYGMTEDVAAARRMGSYHLDSLLGQGGMGEVWLAHHRFLARPAAVKFVRAETIAGDPEQQRLMLTRFEREAQATALLGSPHTIDLYDFGISDDGRFYYVMELLNGLDIDALVSRFGPIAPARAVYLLAQMCDSLGEAHDRGLIHRDVKPANVYVCRQGREFDFVKVLDFGLVKMDGDSLFEGGQLTGAAGIHGTPNFMAPEQAIGRPTDARSDIYALGCVAYWMLTGANVFQGLSVIQTLMMHVNAEPETPSDRIAGIPRSLDEIVLACLEKDPANRPQHVDDVAAALNECQVGERWTQRQAAAWWSSRVSDTDTLAPIEHPSHVIAGLV